ncbi:MAG: pirin family protein [Bacteriovoracaceae bacterium]
MKKSLHRANTRGIADHGWLKSKHSFSFASYHNPERMGFGLLKVLNDDQVSASQGFGTHPHQDMEIVSIPLKGALKHKDSEGNQAVIRHGEVQLMSAGTGVFHSEYNNSEVEPVEFLQIWVMPEKLEIAPRYDQKSFDTEGRTNQWQTIVSPMDNSETGVKINQQAWFSLLDLKQNNKVNYQLRKPTNGVYFVLLEGELSVADERLNSRDALGLEDISSVPLTAHSDSQILAIEVPMS